MTLPKHGRVVCLILSIKKAEKSEQREARGQSGAGGRAPTGTPRRDPTCTRVNLVPAASKSITPLKWSKKRKEKMELLCQGLLQVSSLNVSTSLNGICCPLAVREGSTMDEK